MMDKECKDCDYYCDGACLCSPLDKWYACPIEVNKPENQQALREYAEQVRKKTNGDVIMAMFPNCRPCVGTEIVDTDIAVFDTEWWNAPYKTESEGMSELDKLENYLKEHDIPHERIDVVKEGLMDRHQILVKDEDGVVIWDAVCHFGSYGYKEGLLEIMGTLVRPEDGDSVAGWLTAEDVIKRIENR